MKYLKAIGVGFIMLQAFCSVAEAAYKTYNPCSKKEILRYRDDTPVIKPVYACHQAEDIKIEPIDPLTKVDTSDFDVKKTNEAEFCVALLDEHRQGTELYFTGQLTYRQGKDERVKSIQASAQYLPLPGRQYRSVHQLGTGEYRPSEENVRIYQEIDVGRTVDLSVNRKTQKAQLALTEVSRNRKIEMNLRCELM